MHMAKLLALLTKCMAQMLVERLQAIMAGSTASMQVPGNSSRAVDGQPSSPAASIAWWQQRLQLDQELAVLLSDIDRQWLGAWRCTNLGPAWPLLSPKGPCLALSTVKICQCGCSNMYKQQSGSLLQFTSGTLHHPVHISNRFNSKPVTTLKPYSWCCRHLIWCMFCRCLMLGTLEDPSLQAAADEAVQATLLRCPKKSNVDHDILQHILTLVWCSMPRLRPAELTAAVQDVLRWCGQPSEECTSLELASFLR